MLYHYGSTVGGNMNQFKSNQIKCSFINKHDITQANISDQQSIIDPSINH